MKTTLTKDLTKKTITVTREFAAPRKKVWDYWTKPELLDQWWAPKPYKTETISMNFKNGGRWFYYMLGPNGEKHYCIADYTEISPVDWYKGWDAFCDEKENLIKEMPRTLWKVTFSDSGNNTLVVCELTYEKTEDLEKILEMGFQEGFTMAHGNLDELLKN